MVERACVWACVRACERIRGKIASKHHIVCLLSPMSSFLWLLLLWLLWLLFFCLMCVFLPCTATQRDQKCSPSSKTLRHTDQLKSLLAISRTLSRPPLQGRGGGRRGG